MGKFVIKKVVDLGFLGEDWNGCNIVVTPLVVKELKEIQGLEALDTSDSNAVQQSVETMIDIIGRHFVSGRGFDGVNKVAILKDDIEELSFEILSACLKAMAGTADPKL